jgi:hypothetical protein
MERGSVQHGARLDEELAEGTHGLTRGAPVSARERADLDPEAPTGDEPGTLTTRPDVRAHDLVIARSELATWLVPSDFPGTAGALIAGARSREAPDEVLAMLEQLEPDRHFEVFGDVWIALGGSMERRSTVPAGRPDPQSAEALADAVVGAIRVSDPEPLHQAGVLATATGFALVPVRIVVAVVKEVVRIGGRAFGL